jgi:hypothetical protein
MKKDKLVSLEQLLASSEVCVIVTVSHLALAVGFYQDSDCHLLAKLTQDKDLIKYCIVKSFFVFDWDVFCSLDRNNYIC